MSFELFWLIGGLFFGILLGFNLRKIVSANGKFIINDTDPEADYMKLSIDNRDELWTKKYVLLKIVKTSDTSK